MSTSAFGLEVAQWCEEVQQDHEKIIRLALTNILGRIINRSPVGDPALWKRNAAFQESKERAAQENALRRTMKEHTTKAGRLRKGSKVHPEARVVFGSKFGAVTFMQKRLSKPKGYTGGRFRGNWQVGLDYVPLSAVEDIDKEGSETYTKAAQVLEGFKIGMTNSVFFVNNLPYGNRLEFEGWSKQAPAGMVRISIAEADQDFRTAIKAVKK